MAAQPLTPIQLIDQTKRAKVQDGRAVLSFDSYGASVRLGLSRHAALMLYRNLGDILDELLEQTSECEVIPFTRRA